MKKGPQERKKQLIIVEDQQHYIDMVTRYIAETDWTIFAVAKNTTAALALLEQIQREAVAISVLVLDGTLNDSQERDPRKKYFAEGGRVSQAAKQLLPKIKVVGFSGDETNQRKDPNLDYYVGKSPRKLVKALEFYEQQLGL